MIVKLESPVTGARAQMLRNNLIVEINLRKKLLSIRTN